ncbi:MAG: PIN domain-containing protein [Candidatus Asgardarchaeia archaeon]
MLRYLFTSEHELLISKISIFEALAKGVKLSSTGFLSLERLLSGIIFLEETPNLIRVEYTRHEVIEKAIALRKYINDTIDCIILASALAFADILITEDKKILDFVKNNDQFMELNQLRAKTL